MLTTLALNPTSPLMFTDGLTVTFVNVQILHQMRAVIVAAGRATGGP